MERRLQEIAGQVIAGGRLVDVTGQLVGIPEPGRNGIIDDTKLADPVSTQFNPVVLRT